MSEQVQVGSNSRVIADIEIRPLTWQVVSHCGVVQLRTDHHGCIAALNPHDACRLADELGTALYEAAHSVESASAGGPR